MNAMPIDFIKTQNIHAKAIRSLHYPYNTKTNAASDCGSAALHNSFIYKLLQPIFLKER
jgi:hypothetical protein